VANKIAQRLRLLREKRLASQKERTFSLLKWFGLRRTSGFLLLAAFIALRIWDPPQLENLRLRGFDLYQTLKPRIAKLRPVVIVDIDEASLQAMGQWPWPRTLLAELIDKIQAAGSAAIGFDVIMSEPDRMSPSLVADSLPQIDDDTRAKLKDLPSNDDILARSIARSKVVLGQSGTNELTPDKPEMPKTGFGVIGPDASPFLYAREGLLRNMPVLEMAAAGRGIVTIQTERDNIIRRVPLVMKAGDLIVPALTLEMLRVVTGAGAILIRRPLCRGAGPRIADGRKWPDVDQLLQSRLESLRFRERCHRRQDTGRPLHWAAGLNRRIGDRPSGHQSDPGGKGHAGRRNSRADT
jgi:adenylate cyclase